jgi:hypothetical protein
MKTKKGQKGTRRKNILSGPGQRFIPVAGLTAIKFHQTYQSGRARLKEVCSIIQACDSVTQSLVIAGKINSLRTKTWDVPDSQKSGTMQKKPAVNGISY